MFPPTETELILVIALTSWLTTSRLIRGEALSLRVRDYVQAMRVMGGSSARAVFRHIAPNAVGTIVVNATFQVADAILLGRRAVLPRASASGRRRPTGAACSTAASTRSTTATGGRSSRPASRSSWSSSPSTSSATPSATRSKSQAAAPMTRTWILEIEDLRTEIRLRRSVVHAIDGGRCRVEAGECLGIVGESGCGKTMTALSVMRLLPRRRHASPAAASCWTAPRSLR